MLGITAICKEIYLGQYEIHVLIWLHHAIFISTLLFNCQTWTRIKIYWYPISSAAKIFKASIAGLLLIECVFDIRRFVYLHNILMLTNNERAKNLCYQQLELAFEENCVKEICHLEKQYNIIVEEGYVKSLSREKWKTHITNMVTKYRFNQLKSKQTSMKKKTRTEIWKIWDTKLLIRTSTR